MQAIAAAENIMRRYAADTGLDDPSRPPRRYLWTDAFGVCTFLGLYRQTGDAAWRRLALTLVDQVHHVLGRHRPEDSRSGWISGLDEEAGRRRPTAGGLRIGKPLNERGPGSPVDDRMEWDRDGQYFHYLTIERFWHEPDHREASSWTAHRDINRVMLATRLAPDGFLRL